MLPVKSVEVVHQAAEYSTAEGLAGVVHQAVEYLAAEGLTNSGCLGIHSQTTGAGAAGAGKSVSGGRTRTERL